VTVDELAPVGEVVAVDEVDPPEDYPAREWVEDQSDLFYVPPALRAVYAGHPGLSDQEADGYWSGGATRPPVELTPEEARARAVANGRTATEVETYPERLLVDASDRLKPRGPMGEVAYGVIVTERLRGQAGFRELVHQKRLVYAARVADAQAAREAQRVRAEAEAARRREAATCPACHHTDYADPPVPVFGEHPSAHRARLCTPCRSIAERLLGEAEELAPGRLRADAVREYLTTVELEVTP